jgi:hypothetical protein
MTKPIFPLEALRQVQAGVLEDKLKEQEDNEGLVECDCCGNMRPEEEVNEFYDVQLNPYLKCQHCLEEDWG